MAEIRRNQRLIESVDPVTGETTYRDEVTGEIVVPDAASVVPATETTERVVTQRVAGGQIAPGLQTHESEVYTDDPYAPRRLRVVKLQQAIYLVFGILEGLLGIRFVLRLLGANPDSGFGSFVYGITGPFMWPFANLFGEPSFGGSVIEWNALVAIIVYALLAWVLVKVAWLAAGETRSGVRTSRVNRRIDQ
jgi:YggT family protein